MVLSKNLYNFRANSLLESLIALTIIAICLYIATMIYSTVFTNKTSIKFYTEQSSINEIFYLIQLKQDSIALPENNSKIDIAIDKFETFDKILVKHKDSSQVKWNERVFYINE